MNGRGLHPSPPAKVAHRLGVVLRNAIPHGSAQLTPAPRLDQGNSATCHAHSGVAVAYCALLAKGVTPAYLGSPLMLASCTYADVRAASTIAPYPALIDSGADLQDDATAMAKWGLAPIKSMPTDVPPSATPFPEPDITQLVQGSADLIGGEYAIEPGPGASNAVALCLDARVPVWIGFFCDTHFENDAPDVVRGVPDTSDRQGGGHAVYLSGYRTNAQGGLEFRLENSWGPGWCDNGSCWVSAAFVDACWSLWPFDVRVP